MVVSDRIHNIMGGIETTGDVRLHNQHRKLKQRFDIVKKLGQGTYGKVQLGINKETGQEVAIKTIRKCKIQTEADLVRIRREIQIMSSVRHPNIIHIYEVFENREKMVLVMEYAAGGELYDYLSERKILTEDEARRLFRQIATAVYYCHKHKICHRDLKLENILLDEIGNAKIADFGLSNVFAYSSLLSTFCGSPLYASPEIVQGTPYVGPEVDCWSLGVLLYTLVYGAMPFDGSNFKRLVKQISLADYFEPPNPSPASALIADMLNANPAHRANIQSICSHWWINETYAELCLNVAEELARQTPVRLDLLLSLTTPVVHSENIVVGIEQTPDTKSALVQPKKAVRSQSLHDIPPSVILSKIVPPLLPEIKTLASKNDRKSKPAQEEGCPSKARPKRWSIRPQESNCQQVADENTKSQKSEANAEPETEKEQIPLPPTNEEKKSESPTNSKAKPKIDRGKSKIFDSKKLNVISEKTKVLPKKISSTIVNIEAPTPLEKRMSPTANSENNKPEPVPATKSPPANAIVTTDDPFLLTSTVALNKLAESALQDEPEFHHQASSSVDKGQDEKIRGSPELINHRSNEADTNKAATLPRRKISRAEIHLTTPKLLNADETTNANSTKSFTLLSTKRKQPDHISSAQLDTADSLSSDEDDNFQLLTAENLFSTLLSRVRSLTRRINKDEMRFANFPSTLLTKNGSLFDNLTNRRSNDSRTFSRSESAPWRRSVINNSSKPTDIETSRYTSQREESIAWSTPRPESSSQLGAATWSRQSIDRFIPSDSSASTSRFDSIARTSDSSSVTLSREPTLTRLPATAAKSEARRKLSDILAKVGRSSPAPKLNYSRSLPANALQPVPRAPDVAVTDSADCASAMPQTRQQPADSAKPPARRSRFLRPDFYEVPRENSKYVIQNETVRAFRERSLSRQRDLSRNRSHESFANPGPAISPSTVEYRRSRTCLPATSSTVRPQCRRMRSEESDAEGELRSGVDANEDGSLERTNSAANGFRRPRSLLLSADVCALSEEADRCDRIGRISRDRRLTSSSARKSALLQNELENEIRKTKTMNSKLNGLMVAIDAEYRFGRGVAEDRHDPQTKLTTVDRRRRPPSTERSADAPPFDRLSLLEKKLSYFRKLRNHDRAENDDEAAEVAQPLENEASSDSSTLVVPSLENDASSAASRSPAEDVDSDTCSALSDTIESLAYDDVNDRIRRRSFYSRFNIYNQKCSGNNATAHCAKSSPSTYSRSLSTRSRQESLSSDTLPK